MRTHIEGRLNTNWFWAAILSLLFLLVAAWFIDPLGYADEAQPARGATSTEWTVAPEGPAVPVTLPQVRLKAQEATQPSHPSS